MIARNVALGAMTLLLTVGAYAQAPADSDPLWAPKCVPAEGNGVFAANLPAGTTWSQVRLFFRKAGEADFYFLEMASDAPGSYWAALPQPSLGTAAVDAQLVAIAADGTEITGGPITVPVMSSCPTDLSPTQQSYAQNLVVGETAAGQQGQELAGWECTGVTMRQAMDGSVRTDDVCRQVLMASAAEQAGLDAARSSLLLPVLGGAVGGAAVGYYIGTDRQDPCEDCPVSPVFP